jgi:hypothetical protein
MKFASPLPAPLSPAIETRLLLTLTNLRTAEISLLVLPVLFTAACVFLAGFTTTLVAWIAACAAMSAGMAWARYKLLADEARLSPDEFVRRWRPITYAIAFAFGLVWVLPLLFGLDNATTFL